MSGIFATANRFARAAVRPFFLHILPLAATRGGSLALAFALSILLARILGPEQYGAYALATTVFMIVGGLAGGGLGTYSTRELAKIDSGQSRSRQLVTVMATTGLALSLLISGILVAATAVFLPERLEIFVVALVAIPAAILLQIARGNLNGEFRQRSGAIVSEILRPALLIAVILGVGAFFTEIATARQALWMFAFATVTAATVGYAISGNRLSFAQLRGFDWREVKGILAVSFPLAFVSLLQYMNARSDVLIVAYFLPDAEVGFYQAAGRLSSLVGLAATVVALYAMPRFAKLFAAQDHARLRKLYWGAQAGAVLLSVPVVAALALFGEEIVALTFGTPYLSAVPALTILVFANAIVAVRASTHTLMSMNGMQTKLMIVAIGGLATNIGLDILLIPQLGIVGAAWASLGAACTTLVLSTIFMWKLRDILIPGRTR